VKRFNVDYSNSLLPRCCFIIPEKHTDLEIAFKVRFYVTHEEKHPEIRGLTFLPRYCFIIPEKHTDLEIVFKVRFDVRHEAKLPEIQG
jgi:hypothetical protein